MKYLRAAKNLAITNSLIARYLVEASLIKKKYKETDPTTWRQKAMEYSTWISGVLLKHMSFEVQTNYSRPDLFDGGKKYFMVCNHMSYMDMIFLSQGVPKLFVTSVEMKNTPFLGDIADLGASYFVERRDRTKVPGEVRDLAQLIRDGFNVFVFPEGTSTPGMYILPFKRALFSAAIEAGVDVLPICLRYEMINDEPFSEKNKDLLCWYGSMGFVNHFLKIMTLKNLRVSINYLEPISTKDFPDRHELADQAFEQISNCYFSNRPADFKRWPYPPDVQARVDKLKAIKD